MKKNNSIITSIVLLVIIASLYRVLPGRPLGFAPQIAMALFAGSIVKDKKFAFILPLLTMLFSDIIYEVLFQFKVSSIPGFYNGQILNYLLFAVLTVVGFAIQKSNPVQILAGAISGTLVYFLLSNFTVWIGGGLAINNLPYPKTMDGLIACYTAAIPFLRGSFYATLIFSAILFGGYALFTKYFEQKTLVAQV